MNESGGTKDKILDAAERLFAQNGYAGTSLRMITAAAGANLAAVNYHFRSKETLIKAVYARRIGPVNEKRLAMLTAASGVSPSLEEILRAFVGPMLELPTDVAAGVDFRRLMGRMYVEPGEKVQEFLRDLMMPVGQRFITAFHRALPDLPRVELLWRLHFSIGVIAHNLAGRYHLQMLSGGLCDPTDVNANVERVVAFLAAGLRAPAKG